MGPSTMASPNGAQASEFPQAPFNHSHFDVSFMSDFNTKHTCKMNIAEVINNGKKYHDPMSASSSSSVNIAPPYGLDQEEKGNDERLAMSENIFGQPGPINPGCNVGRPQPLLETKPEVSLPVAHKWFSYEQPSMGLLGSSLSMLDNVTLNCGFSEGQQPGMPAMTMTMAGSTSSEINLNDEVKDSMERKKKRMIKNRESAARSRARKQAYIKQLEDTVKKLEDKNMQLKRQLEEMSPLHLDSIPEPRYQLRRTSSDRYN